MANSDTISRQAAIDTIMEEPSETYYPVWFADKIKNLPGLPEIIRCKDCIYHTCDEWYGHKFDHCDRLSYDYKSFAVDPDSFCSFGRKEE